MATTAAAPGDLLLTCKLLATLHHPSTPHPAILVAPTGKGRGLSATTAAAPGDLLLTCEPLAILYCDEGSTPENEELADQMAAKWVHR